MERWKTIPNFPNYEASDLGVIRRMGAEFPLKPAITKDGYLTVNIRGANGPRSRLVHQLVLEAFVGERPNGYVTRHFPDRNPANNSLGNISWSTISQNMRDRTYHASMPDQKKWNGSNASFGEIDYERVSDLRASGCSYRSIGRWLGMSKSQACNIARATP